MGFSLGDLNTERIYPVLSNPPAVAIAGGQGRAGSAATPVPAGPAPKSARWAKAATPTTVPDTNPDADPNHPLFGHVITLTGDFEPYDKGELWEKMAAVGATVAKNVTKKTTMLVMGPWDSVILGGEQDGAQYAEQTRNSNSPGPGRLWQRLDPMPLQGY